MNARPFAVEHRALAPRQPPSDPIAEIRAAVASLQDVPRESTASIPDILFHSRRVAGRIKAVAERLERTWEPKRAARNLPPPGPTVVALPKREQHREITVARGRRVRVLERGRSAMQMELGL